MKHLILHIGTHKTGTTSLQRFFVENKPILENNWRIFYPESGRPDTAYENRYGHHLLAWSFTRKNGVVHKGEWNRLRDQCILSDATTVLLSSEDFEGFRERDILKLKKYLTDYHVSIVIYLRNPLNFMRSAYKQQISGRSNLALDYRGFLDKNLHRCDYVALIDRWKNVFGKDNINLRVYDAVLSRTRLEVDFLDVLRIKDISSFEFNSDLSNKSISDESLFLVRKINRLQEYWSKSTGVNRLLQKIKRRVIRQDVGASLLLSPFISPLFSHEDVLYLSSELSNKNDALEYYIEHNDLKYLDVKLVKENGSAR